MNPQNAEACANCGTRLTTSATTSSDKTTPADNPEDITPFTPPEITHDDSAPAETAQSARPAFSRSTSSEWLKRLQKTPPPEMPTAGEASNITATPSPAPTTSTQSDVPEWLREIQAEAARQNAAPRATSADASSQTAAPFESQPPAPALGEIKLTGDDYDYSDIGGQVTDEMKAELDANASNLQSVDDEIALARKLLGLEIASETVQTVSQPEPVSQIETPALTQTQLGEIKLTGDDYDYSDIGGQVTDEMKAELDASASNLSSVDDEIALARKLLGLDVAAETVQTISTPQAQAEQFVSESVPQAEPVAEISAQPSVTVEPTAPISETIATETPKAESSDWIAKLGAASAVAATAAIHEHKTQEPIETASIGAITAEPVSQIETPAPVLGEIKLTGDDYDYSDIGGQVTPEMKAELDANASNLQSVDDEIALARKLLGLEVVEQVVTAPASAAEIPPTPIGETSAPLVAETAPVESSDTLAKIAAATAAATAAAATAGVIHERKEQVSAQASETPAPIAEPAAPTLEIPAPVAEPAAPTLESGEMPEWLRVIAPAEIVSEQTVPTSEKGEPARDLPLAQGAILATAFLAQMPDLDEQERGDLPDWLREPVEPPTPEPTAEAEGAQLATALELPAWMADADAQRDPFEVVETTGPLAGVSGILPLALAITEPHTLTSPTPARSDGGRIFQTLLAEPLTASTRPQAAEKPKTLFTTNHILYLLIFLAALIPLFFALDQAGLGLDATASPTAAFYDELESVPAKGAALLAFDYSPGQAVELDPAARAIVNDLAARDAQVIALSSNPNGATLAQSILERAHETHPNFVFVNVGYIPGNEAGLRDLASGWLPASREAVNGVAWGSTPLAQQVQSMNDLALITIIAGDESSLKMWMEQVQPRTTTNLIAATTALLDPPARNYVNAKQLQASLNGLPGAAELELLSNNAGQAVKTIDAVSFVSLVLAGIIIAGNVLWLLRRNKK